MSGIKPMTPVDAKNFIINIVKQRLGESQLATLDTSNMVSDLTLLLKTSIH